MKKVWEYGINVFKKKKKKDPTQNNLAKSYVPDLVCEMPTYEPQRPEKSKLVAAIDEQDVKTVQQELKKNPEQYVNICDMDTWEEDAYPIVFYAVDTAIKQNSQNKKNQAYEIIKIILESGANPNEEREHIISETTYGSTSYHKGDTPLLTAIKAKDAKITGLLLDAQATVAGDIHKSPVAFAVKNLFSQKSSLELVTVLAGHPNVPILQKYLGLFVSIQCDLPDICELFLKSLPADKLDVEYSGYRYLEAAAGFGNTKIMDMLIACGLHKSIEQLPLHAAIRESHDNSLKYLLETGLFDLEAKDSSGNTALLEAARRKNKNAFDELLKHGADMDAESKDKFTVLLGVLQWKDKAMLIQVLEKSTTHINTKLFNTGRSPLSSVASFSNTLEECIETFELLRKYGADVNQAQPQLLCNLCEHFYKPMFNYVMDTYKPKVDHKVTPHPVVALFNSRSDTPYRLEMLNKLFVCTGQNLLIVFLITSGWSGEFVDTIRHKANLKDALDYYSHWPVLRVLWIAYQKGNEDEFTFQRLPWPLFVQIMRWVGETPHLPKLYKDSVERNTT